MNFEDLMALMMGANIARIEESTHKVLEALNEMNMLDVQVVLCSTIQSVADTVGIDPKEIANAIQFAVNTANPD